MKKRILLVVTSLLILSNCGEAADPVDTETPLSKEQAAQMKGKGDHSSIDYCQIYDWYDDDVCDTFCLLPDPDCEKTAVSCGARDGDGDTCGDDEYCAYTEGQWCGAGDEQSTCDNRPEVCSLLLDEVCGCDGQTYSNACFANQAGTGVFSKGGPLSPCRKKVGPVACGARAGDTCGDNEYCAYTEGQWCGAGDEQSTCDIQPEVCSLVLDEVCGCDGQTYSNACFANQAGTGVFSKGGPLSPCRQRVGPVACGARAGDTCGDNEYCAYVEGQLCGAADEQSRCDIRPEACTLLLDEVCGCDGQTYSNACFANLAGTGVSKSGPCEL